jgi:uncharacterized membrane protein
MALSDRYLTAVIHARDAAYDVVLLAHVLAALAGLGAVVVAGAYALALRSSGPGSTVVRRYYRPGVNWAGRVLFLIPVLGVALMAMSSGDWTFSDGWITIGLALWAAVAVVAEMVLWPAERRLQTVVSAPSAADDLPIASARLREECLKVVGLSAALSVALVTAGIIMVAKP